MNNRDSKYIPFTRIDYESKLPPNWGKVLYDKLKSRDDQDELIASGKLTLNHSLLAGHKTTGEYHNDSKALRQCFETQPVVTGPLDGGVVLKVLSEDDQCHFFLKYPKLEVLKLNDWKEISNKTLRCISMTFGENLLDIDFSGSNVVLANLELIMPRMHKLQILNFNDCPQIDGLAMQLIAKLCDKTLTELYIRNTPKLKVEAYMLIAGQSGINPKKLSKLRAIDVSENEHLSDKCLQGLAAGCKQLRYINLQNAVNLTDSGICSLLKSSKSLQLINFSGVINITNKSLLTLAANCPNVVSLNLNRCKQITDVGIFAIAENCHLLQALNLSGCICVTEGALYPISQHCPNILMLNVTGCDISTNGIKALVEGLLYVSLAVSFFGFKPKDGHVEQKLVGHLNMIRDSAIELISEGLKARKKKKIKLQKFHEVREENAANDIKHFIQRYMLRLNFYHMWQTRLRKEGALLIQRVFRGCKGRVKGNKARKERDSFFALNSYGLKLTRVVRGHLTRLKSNNVFIAIREMYTNRNLEAQAGVSVRFQACGRRFLAIERVKAFKELTNRRRRDEYNAIWSMQMLARSFIAKNKVQIIRWAIIRKKEMEDRASTKIQIYCQKAMLRYYSKLSGSELQNQMRSTWKATLKLQAVYRGFVGREKVHHMRINEAVRHRCAIQVQKVFRQARILHWRDMRMNIIAAYVLDRQYLERKDRIQASRKRYLQYVQDNRKDSASEEDDIEPYQNEWVEHYDKNRKKKFWINEINKKLVWDEPLGQDIREKNMVNMRCKIYWVVQQQWYEGSITRFHNMKHRHRIDYDDGDHEWIDLDAEQSRVQLQEEDGSWVMYQVYNNAETLDEWRKMEEARGRSKHHKQAFIDANQWKVISDDHRPDIIFMSTITGEIRTGVDDALDWQVQDDGQGFPSFYNMVTGKTLYEDPRFIHDTDEQLMGQKNHVMAEMRFALYFCRELWDQYTDALESNDLKQQQAVIVKVRNSNKPIHMQSWAYRARALYQASSVVDVPLNVEQKQELEYCIWLSARLIELKDMATIHLRERLTGKLALASSMNANAKIPVFCVHCKRETKKHLQFCKNCGKVQVSFIKGTLEDVERMEKEKLDKNNKELKAIAFEEDIIQ